MQVLGAAAHTDGASLAHLSLTSCCEAWSLTGHGPVPVCSAAQGLGTPALENLNCQSEWGLESIIVSQQPRYSYA